MRNKEENIFTTKLRAVLTIILVILFVNTVNAATVGYWRFENSGVSQYNSPTLDMTLGDTAGYSSSVAGPTIIGDPLAGTNAGSYDHGGTGTASVVADYALINAAIDRHDFTIEFFVYFKSGVSHVYHKIFGNMDDAAVIGGWSLYTTDLEKIVFYTVDGAGYSGGPSSASMTENEWHHVAVTGTYEQWEGAQDTTYLQWYVDGELGGAAAWCQAAGNVGGQTVGIRDANYEAGTLNPFTGGMFDELRISDRVLSPSEFLQLDAAPTTCAEVWDFGFGLPQDLDKNCRVDMQDLERLVANWLECNDPIGSNCP